MSRSTIISSSGAIWIPICRDFINKKIVITASDGTEYDVTSKALFADVKKPLLRGLQSATVRLDNNDLTYLNLFSGGEKIEIWWEYNSVAGVPTHKMYRGKIDYPSYSVDNTAGYTCELATRQMPEASDNKVIIQFSNALISDAIKTIASVYLSGIMTTTNVSDTTTRVTTNYNNVSPWQAIADLMQRASQHGYVDTDNDLHTFDEGTVTNTTDKIAINYNVLSVSNYEKDTTKIKNKVVVSGKNDDNMLILKTEEDTTSQSDLWVKTEFVNASNLESMSEVQDQANLELKKATTDIVEGGSIPIVGSPLLNPGELIKSSVPGCNINGDKIMTDIVHSMPPGDFTTNVTLSSKQDSLAQIFKERIDIENAISAVSNLNYMENSANVFFNESPAIVTLTNCVIVNEILELTAGQSQGEALSDNFEQDNNITTVECRVHTNLQNEDDIITVSNDGGFSWMAISPGEIKNFTSTGKLFKFKVVLNANATNNPRYEALSFLLK